jgi:hypothetical protein
MTIREPIVDAVGSTVPACGYLVTTWSDLIFTCRDLIGAWTSLAASWEHFMVIAGSEGSVSGPVMTGTYDVTIVTSEAIDLTCEAVATWSPLRSTARPSRSTWSSVAFIRSLEVATRCDVMNPVNDAMTVGAD